MSVRPGAEPPPSLVVAAQLRAAAGTTLPVEVSVTNLSSAPRVLAVGAIGVDAGWVPAPVRTPVLAPGASAVVTVPVTPPTGTVPAHYPFAVTAQALDPETGRPAGGGPAMADVVLVVDPRNQLSLELTPRTASMISARRLRLRLRNSGDSVARVRLGVQSSPRLRVRFKHTDVEVPPGATREVRGRATVARGRLVGGHSHHTYTVSARGTESLRHVDGSITQRPAIGSLWLKVAALAAVVAIWVAAAVVFVPQLADRIGGGDDTTTATIQKGPADGKGSGEGSGEGSGNGDSGGARDAGGGGGGATSGGAGGAGGPGGGATAQPAAATGQGLTLSGTVAGRAPGGVRVSLTPTSLVDEEAQGGVGVGVPARQLGTTGMRLASTFLNRALADTPPDRTVTTSPDGTWAFAKVKQPGYYLLTFTKRGFQTRSFVVDSTDKAAAEPLEIELSAGQGRLSGTVTGPGGAVGAATVTITDGTTTITTSSNSKGKVGRWSVTGLSTPGTYVVAASKPGLSAESRLVALDAGGAAGADLALRTGVATLAGRVRAVDDSGRWSGFGGATVTVTGEDGTVRTATTLTQGARAAGAQRGTPRATRALAGSFALPGLPVPGTYVVTSSGEGLQSQTSTITLRRGQSQARVDSDLVSASGSVAGRITGGTDPIVGAGLTLVNADNAYKTMTTSDPAGSFLLDGIAPGTYTLTTQYFGFGTDHVTVTVRAGRTTHIDRTIDEVVGGVLAARSRIQGRVIDKGTGAAIACPDDEACVTARVFEPAIDDDDPDAGVTYSTDFLGTDEFTLPEGAGQGVLPGLHTVRIAAPHYAVGSARVQVPAAGTVNVGTVGLDPAPKIVGTVTSAVGAPSGATCVWVVPASASDTTLGCGSAAPASPPPAACKPTPVSFDVAATDAPLCVRLSGTGTYSVEVPQGGTYEVRVIPSDADYVVPDASTQVLANGSTQSYSVQLHRYGRLTVTARKPGASGNLVPIGSLQVTATPTSGSDPKAPYAVTTASTGRASFLRLPTATYTISATDGAGLTDSQETAVGIDQEIAVDLTLTRALGDVVGRVTTTYDGVSLGLEGVRVRVLAPVGYSGTTTVPGEAQMTTGASGCFAIQRTARSGETLPAPVAGTCTGPWTASDLARTTFLSNAASEVEVTKAGYQPLLLTNQQLSTSGLTSYVLEPDPVATDQLTVQAEPSSAMPWTTVQATVQATGGYAGVAAKVQAPDDDGAPAALSWNDPRVPLGKARAGTYTVSLSAPGYVGAKAGVTCPRGAAQSCAWDGAAPTLRKLGSLRVEATSDGTTPVPGARFTLLRGHEELQTRTATGDTVTFDDLDPQVTDYAVRVQAAGYRFGTLGGSGSLTATCSSPLSIPAGDRRDCTVTLSRLGALTGTVSGIRALAPAAAPTEALGAGTVTATRCTVTSEGWCTEVDAGTSFSGAIGTDGKFRITGTATEQGLAAGDWLVTATSPGYHLPAVPASAPAGAKAGLLVTGLATGADTDVAVSLYVDPVELRVNLSDQVPRPVTGATVTLQSADGTVNLTTATAGSTAGEYRIAQVVPGQYRLSLARAGYLGTTATITVASGAAVDTRYFSMVRGSSFANGHVSATDAAGGLNDVTVRVCADKTCSAGPADGTDGRPMRTTTAQDDSGRDGWFQIGAVPNGTFWLVYSRHGYVTGNQGPYTFAYDAPYFFTDLAPALDPVTRGVAITLHPTAADDVLTTTKVTLTRGATVLDGSAPTRNADGDYVSTFTTVARGCWTLGVALDAATGHHGDVGPITGAAPADSKLGCSAGALAVSGDPDSDVATTATVAVDEARISVKVDAVATFGHALPTLEVALTNGTTSYLASSTYTAGTTLVLWVPTGGGYRLAAGPATPSTYWPATSQSGISVPAAGASAALTVRERASTLAITVDGASATTKAALTIVPAPGNGASLPSGAPTQTSGTTAPFELPAGDWDVTASLAGHDDVTATVSIGDFGAYTVRLTPPVTPVVTPPGGGSGGGSGAGAGAGSGGSGG